jgi:hypothetical protein
VAQPRLAPPSTGDTQPMFVWLLIVGGMLIAISFFTNPGGVPAALGVLLFVSGLVWFFVVAFVSARREGTGVGHAAVRALRGALRLAWEFWP